MINAEESSQPIRDEDLAADLTHDETARDEYETSKIKSHAKTKKKGLTNEVNYIQTIK